MLTIIVNNKQILNVLTRFWSNHRQLPVSRTGIEQGSLSGSAGLGQPNASNRSQPEPVMCRFIKLFSRLLARLTARQEASNLAPESSLAGASLVAAGTYRSVFLKVFTCLSLKREAGPSCQHKTGPLRQAEPEHWPSRQAPEPCKFLKVFLDSYLSQSGWPVVARLEAGRLPGELPSALDWLSSAGRNLSKYARLQATGSRGQLGARRQVSQQEGQQEGQLRLGGAGVGTMRRFQRLAGVCVC